MKELHLVSVDRIIEGGSTKPLLITAQDNDGNLDNYVLKSFKKDNINQNFTVAKELIFQSLAKEFDLNSPDSAVINVDHNIFHDFYKKEECDKLDSGYKFCSKYEPAYAMYSNILHSSFLKRYELENIFAFDNLILNVDRGGHRNKPNILIGDDDFLLIDHELSLPFYDSINQPEEVNFKNKLNSYLFNKHIFHQRLSRLRDKEHIFAEFEEYLRNLNISKIESFYYQLEKFNIEFGDKNLLIEYFRWCKNNSFYFVEVLRDRVL